MKKLIGLTITAIGAALMMLLGVILGLVFEVEQSALDRITSAVNTAAWIPMIGYIISALFQMIKFRKRFDQQSFQPLKKPFGLMVTFIVQVVIFVFSRPASNRGQASIAFVSAMVVVLVMSVITFSASMVWGRPIPGRTEMPFSNSN